MDKLERYRAILRGILQDYGRVKPSYGVVEAETIIDPIRDHYELQYVGWHGERRIHGSVIHLDLIDGKVWIQYDGTNRPVADALLEAGVPAEDIVLAFHPENVRQYTDFAVR